MIDKKFQSLIEDLQSVKMTREEKNDVLHRVFDVVEKMESNFVFESKVDQVPFVASPVEAFGQKVKTNFYTTWYQYVSQRKFVPSVALLFVLVCTGGVSLAAEGSLPGDALYSLKVNVNESVKSFVAVTPEAKAKFALEVTDKRLKEAAILSQSGKLNTQTGEIIKKQLNRQANQVKFQVASLVSTNNLRAAQEIAVNFESSLRAHELILERISDERAQVSSANIAQIDNLIFALKTEIATTTASRNDIQAREIVLAANTDNKAKIEVRLGEVNKKLLEIKTLVASTSVGTSTASTTRLYVAEATRLVGFANEKIAKQLYLEALALAQSAFQYATDAEVLLSAVLTTDGTVRDSAVSAMSAATLSLTPLSTSSSELIMSVTAASLSASSTNASTTSATSTQATSTASTSAAVQTQGNSN